MAAIPRVFAEQAGQGGTGKFLDNITNELYHNHLNYLKDLVPEMGRNFKVLYNVKF